MDREKSEDERTVKPHLLPSLPECLPLVRHTRTHLRPHDVGERLRYRKACHCGGVQQALHGLLAAGRGDSRGCEVARRNHPAVGQRRLERSYTLLLGDEACYTPVYL